MGEQNEKNGQAEVDAEKKKRELRKSIGVVIYALIGGLISVGSFLLFFYTQNTVLTVFICIVCVVYSYINGRIFFKDKDWNGVRQIFIPLMMVVYYAIVFAVITVGNAMADGVFSYLFFVYPIFLMPAFELEILLFALIASGM